MPKSMMRFLLLLMGALWGCQAFAQADEQRYSDWSYTEVDSVLTLYYKQGAYQKAVTLAQVAKTKAKREFGEKSSKFAHYTIEQAYFYSMAGDYEKAIALYIRAKDIYLELYGEMDSNTAISLNSLAVAYKLKGDYDKALPLYIRAKNIREKVLGKEHADFATSLNNLALLYARIGDYDKGLPLLMEAKRIREKTLGANHHLFAESLNNLSQMYRVMELHEEAIPLLKQAMDIYEEVLGKEHPRFAYLLGNLAVAHAHMGEYEKARPLLERANTIRAKTLGTSHPAYAQSLGSLAEVYINMGKYNQAKPLAIKVKEIYEKALGLGHPDVISSLTRLARLYRLKGNYFECRKLLEQAMNRAASVDISHDFTDTWVTLLKEAAYPSTLHILEMLNVLNGLYDLLEETDVEKASEKQERVADLALALFGKARSQVINDSDKSRMLSYSNEWLLKALTILDTVQQADKAFELADQNKSVLLLQATKSETLYQLGNLPDSLVEKDKALLEKQSALQVKLMANLVEEEATRLRNELIEVNEDIDRFMLEIEKNYPKYYKLKYAQIDAQLEEIQALLDEQTALIEYVVSDSVLHVFRVDKEEVLWTQLPIPKAMLKEQIEAFHNSLSDYKQIAGGMQEYERYTTLAHWFYENLLREVLENSQKVNHLVIVTDAELGHLPFESFLMSPAAGKSYKELHYLLRDYTLSYSYSATLWKENKSVNRRQNNGQLLGMASQYPERPDSNLLRRPLSSADLTREVLHPLPAAREEVQRLSALYEGYFTFDSLTTERLLREKIGDYAVVHLAMHGILNENRPLLSALALTDNKDSLYDNFWQAHEISKMDLSADLVVLSACETGYGRFETGNGIASLARSFMYAGVPSLVVSLWQVNDASTSSIMQNLYAHLADGLDKAEALRKAKLDYINQVKNPAAAHPAFWSPFILMGDSDPVELEERSSMSVWWLGGAALLAGTILLWLFIRKQDS